MILKNEYNITLDIKRNIAMASQTPVFISNDSATLFINVVENGKPYDFSSADRYVAVFRRPDQVTVQGLGELDSETGLIKYELGSTEMAVHGNLEATIQMYLGEYRISTRPFNIKILRDYEGGIGSEDQLTVLQSLFIEVDQVKLDTLAAKDEANSAALYARNIRDNFGHKGEYDNTKTYKDGNVVSYGGVNYMCILETTAGINPLNGTYWVVISPQASINEQTWTASEGQRTFTLANGKYVVGKGNIEVWVGGVPQIKDQGYGESSETTITLTEGVPAGTIVYAKWFEGHMYITKGHQSSHTKGGQDEIDVTQLRNFKENVTDKFTSVDVQLADMVQQKADKTEVNSLATAKADKSYVDTNLTTLDTKINSQASGSPKGVYATVTALQTAFPTGNSNTYVVTTDGKWYYWNGTAWTAGGTYQSTGIAEGDVTPSKTSFLLLGKNLFNKNAVTSGYYVYPTNGNLTASAGYNASEFIGVTGGETYTWSNNIFFAWYDANKTFISGGGVADSSTPTTATAPSNAKYVRVTIKTAQLNSFQFEKGSSVTSYEAYKQTLKGAQLESNIFQEQFNTVEVLPTRITGYTVGKNLFNKDKATAGGYISNTTGNVVASADFYYSEYIPVQPNTQYTRKGTYSLAFYDANKVFISGINGVDKVTLLTTPANSAYLRLSTYKQINNGVAGINEEQLELGAVSTIYEPYNFTVKYLTLPKDESTVSINLPSKINCLVGQELNIYFDNIISDKDTKFDFDVTCSIGSHYESFFRVTPSTAGSYALTISAFKDDKEVARGTSTIVVTSSTVGNAVTKKVLIIGDSTTDNSYLVPKLNGNFSTDVMKIEAIGTRGTAPNKHEGRAGWTTSMFFGENPSYTSPFMFNGTFDFSQYIATNGLSTPDYVFINLGINDLFGVTDDATLTTSMNSIITKYNTMISSIKAQNAAVKIGICLTIPPHYSQDAFGSAYQSGQTRRRYKRNNFLWVKKLIETFANREAENIYLVPINLNLDTRYNFESELKQVNARNTTMVSYPKSTAGVHPAESGYWQIADTYWYFLKSFEV